MPAAYSSEDEQFSSGEEELSEEELAAALELQREQVARGGGAAAGPAGSDEEEDGEGEQGGAQPAQRPAIYNVDAIHDKLEDIGWAEEAAWDETLALTSAAPVALQNTEDDLERELAFYNQALEAAKTAIGRFEAAGIAWQRPADYYAEMVKSDEHMAKVKEQLLFEKQQIEAAEQRKKDRESKRFAKQVAAERKKERAADKKAAITNISKLRKQREKSGFAGELDMDKELDRMEGSGGRQQQAKGRPGERFTPRDKSKKRAQRDSKYGFGGPKRLRKQNDASSAADVDGYRPSRFDDGVARKVGKKFGGKGGGGAGGVRQGGVKKGGGGGPGGKGKGKGKQQRPGKARRAAMNKGR